MVLVKTLTGTRGSGLVRKNVSKIIRFKTASRANAFSRIFSYIQYLIIANFIRN